MELKDYRPLDKGSLKSIFTLVIPEWGGLETECSYFEKDTNSYWITCATKMFSDQSGKKTYYNMTRFNANTMKALARAVRDKIIAKDYKLKEVKHQQAEIFNPPEPDDGLPF